MKRGRPTRTSVPVSRTPKLGCRAPSNSFDRKASGIVLSVCWCDSSLVWVTPDDVYKGRTISCGLDGCEEN